MSGRLLLVGWEVGDTQCLHSLVDSGELPTLEKLLETGVGGALTGPRPPVDSALWASIATGKRAWQHGALTSSRESVADPASIERTKLWSSALWDILDHVSLSSLVVGWPMARHSLRPPGAIVSDRFHIPTAPPGHPWPPAPKGIYNRPELAEFLDSCRISPETIGADALARFVPDWQRVDQSRDPRLGRLRILLAADLSYLAALTALMPSSDWSLATVRFRGIGEIWRLFGPDHFAEKGPYRNVVRAAYELLDQMLETLLGLGGPELSIAVVTAGGVDLSPDRRTLSASPHGFVVFSGPGFVSDELLHGASTLDVVPTLLHWFKLPVGEDMEGRILSECFAGFEEIPACRTWEAEGFEVPDPPLESGSDVLWNYVCSCLDGSRLDLALPALEELFRTFPENVTFTEALFNTQLALGLLEDAEQTFSVLEEIAGQTASIRVSEAELAMVRKDIRQAREMVQSVVETTPLPIGVWRRIGLLLAGLRNWEDLDKFARLLIQQNDRDEIAWLGLAEASLRLGNPRAASAAARQAIGLKFFLPEAHMVLARALARDGMPLAAIEATERLLKIHPDNPTARIYLRRLRRSLAIPHQEPAV